jgi:hypothetical protein
MRFCGIEDRGNGVFSKTLEGARGNLQGAAPERDKDPSTREVLMMISVTHHDQLQSQATANN